MLTTPATLRRSIAQVREYQAHVLPKDPEPLRRPGVELGMRFTPIDSAGLYFPGGKASYPSSLIMLAVPAQAASFLRRRSRAVPARQPLAGDLLVNSSCEGWKPRHAVACVFPSWIRVRVALAKGDSDRAGKLLYEHAMESRERLHAALR